MGANVRGAKYRGAKVLEPQESSDAVSLTFDDLHFGITSDTIMYTTFRVGAVKAAPTHWSR